jgi:hypothetical protein
VNEKVSVVPDRATVAPVARALGVTGPTVGEPAVPAGTVMVTEVSNEVVPVVNE